VLSFPLITMRIYSEEYRMALRDAHQAPVKDWQVVLSKFAGVLIFYCILWTPTLCSFAVFQYITGKTAGECRRRLFGTYCCSFSWAASNISIGCLASALTKDQINAATISFTTITLLLFLVFYPTL